MPPTRVVIVRRGDPALFATLWDRFTDDPGTAIIYDRRAPTPNERHRGERRFEQSDRILAERGFYVVRYRPRQDRRDTAPGV